MKANAREVTLRKVMLWDGDDDGGDLSSSQQPEGKAEAHGCGCEGHTDSKGRSLFEPEGTGLILCSRKASKGSFVTTG